MGYTASKLEGETSVCNGYVIYEGSINWEEVKNTINNSTTPEKEILNLQSKYNQYVWVPVSEEELTTIYGVDNNGKFWGKLYTYTSSEKSAKNWREINGKIYVTIGSGYNFEPGLGYGSNNVNINELQVHQELNMNREELQIELEQNYYKTIKSIKKYGGFYIGRYETGLEEENAVVKKMNKNISNQKWSKMYKKTKNLNGENENVITTMINGSLWDYTLQWLIDTGAKNYNTIYLSETWGNYANSSFEYYTDLDANTSKKNSGTTNAKIIPAGSSEYTKANNIYDMAGNVTDLTLESYSNYFTDRGGNFSSTESKKNSIANRSYKGIYEQNEKNGSRAVLLIK